MIFKTYETAGTRQYTDGDIEVIPKRVDK